MPPLPIWFSRLRPVVDPAIALAVFGLSAQPLLSRGDCGCQDIPAWGWVLVAAECAPLAVRRRWPFTVVMVVGLLSAVYGLSSLPDPPVYYAGLIALYTVAAHSSARLAYTALAVSAVTIVVTLVLDAPNADYQDTTVVVATWATAFLLGESARHRRERTAQLEERAAQLERTNAAEAAAAVEAERNRISRELHDVVAHHVSMMVVQAEAGPVVVDVEPEKARAAFDAISDSGKQALAEMRHLLGVLKQPETAPLTPQPGIDQIADLVDGAKSAGLAISLTVKGDRIPLPLAVDLSAYRVVQEALTNCVRHAPNASVQVVIEYGDLVVIDVSDAGADGDRVDWGDAPASTGHGLNAMRERVATVGGTLHAGPRRPAGWSVRAVLPTRMTT
ncbi:MAG TPA: histidine kinase [Nocardioidaceae bacterium]|nr:histidine kinase [Nocardioidaceae bacterium]